MQPDEFANSGRSLEIISQLTHSMGELSRVITQVIKQIDKDSQSNRANGELTE